MKRALSLVICLVLIFGCMTSTAAACGYSSQISQIHSSFRSGNTSASSAPQQQVNGAYRCVELLEIIALEYSVSSSTVSDIHSTFRSSNTSASSAPQQLVNGLYRSVELLEAIAYKLDR